MSVESNIERTSGQVWRDVLRESFSLELTPPIRIKTWGRMGINAPYSIIIREDIVRNFLREEARLRPDQIYKTQLHILGERPHKLPKEERNYVFPKDERKKPHHAWISVDKRTDTHTITIAAFKIWEDFARDRRLFIAWGNRKRKTDEGWEELGKKTKILEANNERRQLIESATPDRLGAVLDDLISSISMKHVLQLAFHEINHSFKYRNRYQEWPISERVQRIISNLIEPDAEEAEELHLRTGKWDEMIQFMVNQRTA